MPDQWVSDDANATDILDRPWTAEIPTYDGLKSKYNLPTVSGEASTAVTQSLTATLGGSPQRSMATKAARESWAASAPKGVDFDREKGGVPQTAQGERPEAERIIQGYFASRHPQFKAPTY